MLNKYKQYLKEIAIPIPVKAVPYVGGIAATGLAAGAGVFGYGMYKNSKRLKNWKDNKCTNISEKSEKRKCENYLKSISKKD